MGGLNEKGIYLFDETDEAAPFSELLNLLGQSVSDAIGEFLVSPGAEPFSLSSGTTEVSGYACESYRVGPWMFSWGRMTRTSSSATQVWGNVAGGTSFIEIPTRIVEVGDFGISAFSRVYIDASGAITTTGTPAGASTLTFQAMWLAQSLLP